MVLDLMTGGDLKYHLQQTGSFLEEAVRFIASELVCVISFLHENHIVHRDIKPGNILFDFDGHVHLTDFNVAAKIPQDGSRLFAVSGTPAYMAPEVIAKKTGYTATCDWWSLGVVLYELVCGKKPFKGSNRAEMKRNVLSQPLIFRHNVKKCLSENCIDFISSLLDRDPVLRTRRIKTHPWFQDIDWDAVGKKEANPIFVPHPDRCHFALELEAEATELYYTPQSRKNTTNIDCFTETFREFKLSSCHLVD